MHNVHLCEAKRLYKNGYRDPRLMISLLDRSLAERSGLTSAQVDVMLLEKRVRNGELNAKTAAAQRESRPVTMGAYHRVLAQARSNVAEAIYTLLLCERVDVVRGGDLIRLLDMIGKSTQDKAGGESEDLVSLIDSLVTRLVTI